MNLSTKEKIKNVALPLFADKGYEGATMNEIADLVGIKKASLYAHYRSKEELFFAIYEDTEHEYINVTQGIIADCEGVSVEIKLMRMFEGYVRYYCLRPDVQRFWIQTLFFTPSDVYRKFYTRLNAYQSKVDRWIEDTVAEGMRCGLIPNNDPAKIRFAYVTFREGLLNGIIFQPEMNREENIKSMWSYFWLGVKGR